MNNKETILKRHLTRMVKFERLYIPVMAAALRHYIGMIVKVIRTRGAGSVQEERYPTDRISKVITSIFMDYGGFHARLTRRQIRASMNEEKAGFGINEELNQLIIDALTKSIFSDVISITETLRKEILAVIEKGVGLGWGIDKIIAQLEQEDFPIRRARVIVRTELTKAMNAGQQAAKEESDWETEDIWISAHDRRTRHSHTLIDQYRVSQNEKFPVRKRKGGFDMMTGPGDPTASAENVCNCFPADTLVEGQFIGAQRLKYSGQIIEIITRSGKRLSITPNHPIFTTKGTIAADHVAKGDYVFSNIKKFEPPTALVNDYIQKEPALAGDLFGTLNMRFPSEQTMVTALDFYGDGVGGDGYIDTININGELQLDSETLPEDIGKFSLKPTNVELLLVSRFRSFNKFIMAPAYSSGGDMGSADLSFSGGLAHLRPFQYFSIGTATNWNTSRFKGSHQGNSNDARFISKLLHGNPGVISLDEIIEVRNRFFSGHVYDFSTLSGAILANNIYISNCRCTKVTRAKRDANGRFIRKRKIFVALPGEMRPVRVASQF